MTVGGYGTLENMNAYHLLALMFDPAVVLLAQALTPDAWQRELLVSCEPYLLLNCARQTGKSTTVAALALHRLLTAPRSLVLVVAPSERQSHELFRKVLDAYHALGPLVPSVKANQSELELENGSRLVALPGREETIRSFSGVDLLILDEASRVPDDLYRSVRPMLAVSQGRLIALSTPFGQRGWFYEEWVGSGPWKRVHVAWPQCPRIAPDFIAEETRALGQAWVDQEYNGLFTAMEGLVYPEFDRAITVTPQDEHSESWGSALTPGPSPKGRGESSALAPGPSPKGRGESSALAPGPSPMGSGESLVGGIDFGWRNPFAAVWGRLDADDVLWITHERYCRETPLSDHAAELPREVMWHADPAGATEIAELCRAGLRVRRGDNNIRRGIALITGRIRSGRLKVSPACINLIAEARLYRYPTPAERQHLGENPIDAHNHALAALRYLVSRLVQKRSVAEKAPAATPIDELDDERGWVPV